MQITYVRAGQFTGTSFWTCGGVCGVILRVLEVIDRYSVHAWHAKPHFNKVTTAPNSRSGALIGTLEHHCQQTDFHNYFAPEYDDFSAL